MSGTAGCLAKILNGSDFFFIIDQISEKMLERELRQFPQCVKVSSRCFQERRESGHRFWQESGMRKRKQQRIEHLQ